MGVAEYTITIDGQTYNKGDTLPDLVSWVATSAEGNIRHYEGLSPDGIHFRYQDEDGSFKQNMTGLTKYSKCLEAEMLKA